MKTRRPAVAVLAAVLLAACTQAPPPSRADSRPRADAPDASSAAAREARPSATAPARETPAPAAGPIAPPAVDPALPKVVLHKTPTCGCCTAWGEHMQRHGFAVEVRENEDLEPVRKRLGVPAGKGSCHTAEVGGLVVEGHVPAEDVKRLLAANDGSRGLTVPGMPMGSPGMEAPDGRVQRYTVERIDARGTTQPHAVHGD